MQTYGVQVINGFLLMTGAIIAAFAFHFIFHIGICG